MQKEENVYDLLFVEDEKAIRDNYVSYLKKHFNNVYEAEDGEQAYTLYKEKKPHLMIVDINIPKMNGLELVKKIREDDRTTKIIILTAHTDTEYLLSATELMLTKYLVKPITRATLKEALSTALDELVNFNIHSNTIMHLKENYTYSLENGELLHDGKLRELTNLETKMLKMFFSNLNVILSYDEIIYELWDSYDENKINSIKTIIKQLRQKLPKNSINNVFGVGYKASI
jgi:DNA-binding response OmpR family regulator